MYGGSTGGWIALAQLVFYPHVFGLCIANAPDPVDFHALGTLDLYDAGNEQNAYLVGRPSKGPRTRMGAPAASSAGVQAFKRTYRVDMRDYLDRALTTSADVNALELAMGSHSRSGGQYDIWQAVFSPVGSDGYPEPIWDKANGAINMNVAEYWRAHYDLANHVHEHWPSLGPLLTGKIRVNVGMSDAFFLNNAVYRLQNALDRVQQPPARASFRYGTSGGRGYSHAWSGDNSSSMRVNDLTLHQRLVAEAVDHMLATAPSGADTISWRY